MSDVLNLQDDQPEVPQEEKRSNWSIAACHNSYKSLAACFVK
jgi:hypothetical protein